MRLGIIYKATNTVNGKCYIGQTIQTFKRRKAEHLRAAFSPRNKRYNTHFYRAIREYGKENFTWEVLAEGILIDDLNSKEIAEIRVHNSFGRTGYNSHLGGGNGRLISEETREKLAAAKQGTRLSIETRAKISESNRGRCVSAETIKKISDAQKGKFVSDEIRKKISQAGMGIRNINFGKRPSDETRRRQSETMLRVWREKKAA